MKEESSPVVVVPFVSDILGGTGDNEKDPLDGVRCCHFVFGSFRLSFSSRKSKVGMVCFELRILLCENDGLIRDDDRSC